MKRIGEPLIMQVELLEAKMETRPFGAAEVAAMSAATSPGTGLAYGLRRVCARLGSWPASSFYAMTSGQHAEHAAGKASGTEALDLGLKALLVAASSADLEASPWEGEG